jgi:hypothetical protein
MNSKFGGPGWDRTNDQPIMRPATDRVRECQGVSGVLNEPERPIVFVSQSVLECHGGVVKTGLLTKAPSEAGNKHGDQKRVNRCARSVESTSRCEAERLGLSRAVVNTIRQP